MSRHERRAFARKARHYLKSDPDGTATVVAAASWVATLPLVQGMGISDSKIRALVVALRSEDRVLFVADEDQQVIKLIEADGAALSPLTILAGLSRIGHPT